MVAPQCKIPTSVLVQVAQRLHQVIQLCVMNNWMFISCSHHILIHIFLEAWPSIWSFRDLFFFHLEPLPSYGSLWSHQAGFPWEPTGTSVGSVFSWPEINHMVTLPERGARRYSPATSPRGKEGDFGMHVAISASWVRTVWTDGVTSRGLSGRRSVGSLPRWSLGALSGSS